MRKHLTMHNLYRKKEKSDGQFYNGGKKRKSGSKNNRRKKQGKIFVPFLNSPL